MAEATVLISEVQVKEGVSQKTGKPWKRLVVKDGNGEFYSTFEPGLFEPAQELQGQRAVITFEQEGNFRNLSSIRAAEKPIEEKMGTGEYVKGQSAPTDARRILLCVAWERAEGHTAMLTRLATGTEWTPALLIEATRKFANEIYIELLRKSGLMTDEDIPF